MSVAGYLSPDEQRACLAKKSNESFGTPVVRRITSSENSTSEQQRNDAIDAVRTKRPNGADLPVGLIRAGDEDFFYDSVEDYDPVLRSHCRL